MELPFRLPHYGELFYHSLSHPDPKRLMLYPNSSSSVFEGRPCLGVGSWGYPQRVFSRKAGQLVSIMTRYLVTSIVSLL